MAINNDLQKNYIGEYIELIDIDLTLLGGSKIYIVPGQYAATKVVWRGNTYDPLPLEATGFDQYTDGAPPRPKLSVSNVSLYLMAAVNSLDDLVGGTVTRWRTLGKYLDQGSNPDPNQHFPLQKYTIAQKVKMSPFEIEFLLVSDLDRPGRLLPRRQVLRDKGFPGAALTGLRGRQ